MSETEFTELKIGSSLRLHIPVDWQFSAAGDEFKAEAPEQAASMTLKAGPGEDVMVEKLFQSLLAEWQAVGFEPEGDITLSEDTAWLPMNLTGDTFHLMAAKVLKLGDTNLLSYFLFTLRDRETRTALQVDLLHIIESFQAS